MRGYIYALINPSLNGLVKVGKTTRSPEERARELSSSTGVPTPFIVGYSALVSNCEKAEMHLHELLSSQGYRLSDNREFFQVSLNQIVQTFLECEEIFPCSEAPDEPSRDEHVESAESIIEDLLREANDSLTGENGSFIDPNIAEEKLKTATKLGSAEAYFRLGGLYGETDSDQYNAKKSLMMFNMALKYGYSPFSCLAQMASTYATNGDKRNAGIAYGKLVNDRELVDAIKKQLDYERAYDLIAERSDDKEDEFFTSALEELVDSEFNPEKQEDPEEVFERETILNSAAVALCLYFFFIGSEKADPILAESIIQLFPLTKAHAENLFSDNPVVLMATQNRTYLV